MDCLSKRLFIFTNVTEGDVYNYTVTITNVVGSTVKNGSIVLEQTCPPSAQSCCSAFPISHQSCSVSNTESSTPSSTMESCGSNCVLPWIVGVIVGTAVVSLLI
ncbi:PREDICTED: uncharacterized protein LOC109585300 [Amphimedon queenslandica]|uniref:Uncharacterized protein n=1 Tax=Amphimedon queenslandica TaxID=400682 RepID=A0AAN0JIS4_AMPQE|nr:PREDICTED: uncharacterized protein LOC109585300 [Amphimedon queenslandica]|eukprot:XP_019856869.1 PREDICTED: uncharacterized protein LOC109585300 [Amphimedon queenslandica]